MPKSYLIPPKRSSFNYYCLATIFYFMQFERITYQRVFNLGNYESVRIGADVLVNPGEDAKQALNEAIEFVEQYRKENKLYHIGDQTPEIPIIPKVEKSNHMITREELERQLMYGKNIPEQIQSCTELKTLESYKFIVRGKPDLQTIYDNKLKSLQ